MSTRAATRCTPAALRLAARPATVALALVCGCDALTELKQGLRGEHLAGLRIDVQPETGITILLDDVAVATASPYAGTALDPGTHSIEVRAPGYHTFRLPLELAAGRTLVVPIALRPSTPLTPSQRAPALTGDNGGTPLY